MSPTAATVALLMFGLSNPSADLPGGPAVGRVVVSVLEVFDEPDDRTMATSRLSRGDRVKVLGVEGADWLRIALPAGSFWWIEKSSIREGTEPLGALVRVERAQVRSGNRAARLPGPPRGSLPRGTEVRLLNRPPLVVRNREATTTWCAIVPPEGAYGYVRATGVGWIVEPPHDRPREERAGFEPGSRSRDDAGPTPPAIASALAPIDASRDAQLRAPVAQRRLEPIRAEYQALLAGARDEESSRVIRSRIARVDDQAKVAEAVRTIEEILERSRRRDRKLALYLRRIAQAELPQERPYDARGMIQPSSKKVDGQKVFALIGPDGNADAYLEIPAGLDPTPFLARHVGVRGRLHYSEDLHARLITVDDIDPLDDEP